MITRQGRIKLETKGWVAGVHVIPFKVSMKRKFFPHNMKIIL